jgi:hypothetical protein
MKTVKIIIASLIVLFIAGNRMSWGETGSNDYAGESILYLINPFGRAEYNDLGLVDLKGVKARLVVFHTRVLLFDDVETIYSDPESLFPYRIERRISKFWGKEFIVEEYDQKNFTVVISKFKGSKLVARKTFKASGPIENAIMLPFSMRRLPDPAIGNQFIVRLPEEFKLELVSVDEVAVPAGKFRAYHFQSTPDNFEIWINRADPRVPLKIQGKGGYKYSLLMKEYIPPARRQNHERRKEKQGALY